MVIAAAARAADEGNRVVFFFVVVSYSLSLPSSSWPTFERSPGSWLAWPTDSVLLALPITNPFMGVLKLPIFLTSCMHLLVSMFQNNEEKGIPFRIIVNYLSQNRITRKIFPFSSLPFMLSLEKNTPKFIFVCCYCLRTPRNLCREYAYITTFSRPLCC